MIRKIDKWRKPMFWICLGAVIALSKAVGAQGPCDFEAFSVKTDFEGAAVASCRSAGTAAVVLGVVPENEPINNSPWYAFRLESDQLDQVVVDLKYQGGTHRYTPKISRDGRTWESVSAEQVEVLEEGAVARFSVPIYDGATWVSAQPLLGSEDYTQWLAHLGSPAQGNIDIIGKSVEGRPLQRLFIYDGQTQLLLILGRQHPPETTGAVALKAFVERLLEDDPLSQAFIEEVAVVVYPLINPDGVARGHWRHNVGGKDLNRDWGPFEQSEPRQVNQDVEQLLSNTQLSLGYVLDFHSTWYDVFYTQKDSHYTQRKSLTSDWLALFETSMRQLEPEFKVNRKGSHNAAAPTSKSYFFNTYGAPATTYEIGDNSPVERIKHYARKSAEAFMQAWLNQDTNNE